MLLEHAVSSVTLGPLMLRKWLNRFAILARPMPMTWLGVRSSGSRFWMSP